MLREKNNTKHVFSFIKFRLIVLNKVVLEHRTGDTSETSILQSISNHIHSSEGINLLKCLVQFGALVT